MKVNTSRGFAARTIRLFRQAAAFPATGIKAVEQALKAIGPYCLYGGTRKRMVQPAKAGCFLRRESPECPTGQKKKAEAQRHGRRFCPPIKEGVGKGEKQNPAFLKAEWMPSSERNSVYKRKSRNREGGTYNIKGIMVKPIKGYGRLNGRCGSHPHHPSRL